MKTGFVKIFAAAVSTATLLASCATAPQVTRVGAFTALDDPDGPEGVIRAIPMLSAPLDETKALTRIVFASCAQQREDQLLGTPIPASQTEM